jgi:thioredoxin-dependent peroxiredoxin
LSQLGQLEAELAQFQQKNSEVMAIAVQDQAGAQTSAQQANASFPILADPDHRVAEAYGVYNLLGDGVATPAVFVIDTSGQIIWSHIGQNISDRPTNETILENLPAE